MTQLDTRPVPAAPWPAHHATDPGPTLEEIVRPYGARASVAFVDQDGARTEVTYDELAGRIAAAAAGLRANGVRPGDAVAMTVANDLVAIVAALGVWAAGGVLVSLPPAPRRGYDAHAERFGAVLAAMDCRFQVTAGTAPLTGRLAPVPIASLFDNGGRAAPDPEPRVPDVALVQFTSGSLGTPKGVAIRRDAFARHTMMIGRCFGLDPAEDRVVTWLPLYHDLGFVCFFGSALAARTGQTHADPRSFVLNPARWLLLLAEERATVSGAPNFAYRLASRVPYPDGLDLSRMRSCLNAAERVLWSDLVDFHRVAGPLGFRWEAIMPAYGLAEGTVGVSCAPFDRGPVRGPGGHVSLGRPLPGNRLSVVGGDGTAPGTLFLGGDWLFDGYWTADGFRPRPDGPFDTNDAAFLQDGELYVIGRHAEVASIGGHNIFAEDVEAVALRAGAPAVLGCAAFKHDEAGGERFGLVLELSPRAASTGAEVARVVRGAVADALNTRVAPLVVVQQGTIPRTTSGKPRRRTLRAAYAAGDLPERRVYAVL